MSVRKTCPMPGKEGATSLALRLRERTAAAHQRTEGSFGFRHIQQGTLTPEIYAELLSRLHSLYVPAERAILSFLASGSGSLTYQPKAPRLRDDLTALGVSFTPVRERPLVCDDGEHGVALLYVLEGATLGGKILTARVRSLLGELGRDATHFFDGAALGTQWLATRRFLDEVAGRHSLDEATILDRAVEVFTWFGAGLDEDP